MSLLSHIANFLEPFARLMGLDGYILTAINMMIFTVLHFPCTTTLLTVKKETGRWKWVTLAFALPTVCGIIVCMCTNLIFNVFSFAFL